MSIDTVVATRPSYSIEDDSYRHAPAAVERDFVAHYPIGPYSSPIHTIREPNRPYGGKKRPLGPEAILHMAWRNAGLQRAKMRGRDGHTYSIVYGGKPGGSLGPDFTDAVVERDDGTVFRGDIEIHVRESDWRAHGHHTDPRYNGVVLHVVAAESPAPEKRPFLKASGSTIPLLALNWKPDAPRPTHTDPSIVEPPVGKGKVPPAPLAHLMGAGLERFHSQAAGIALDIEAFGADQAIWLGIVGALGYPRNKRAFRAVATRASWEFLSSYDRPSEIERLLMHAAGLEATAGGNSSTGSHLSSLRKMVPRGSPPDWVRPWGRPANAPATRIKAIAELVPIWASNGGIASVCRRAVEAASNAKDLASTFRPQELVRSDDATVIGAARAAEIVVNILLPAVLALASRQTDSRGKTTHLKNRVIELYSSHPKLADNSVTKEAKIALGVDYTVPEITGAQAQQGLITLYREMVRHGIRPRQTRFPGVF